MIRFWDGKLSGAAAELGRLGARMRKLVSSVDEVFQIAERGCVVAPGIPRSSDARIKIGDRLWLTRPDGLETATIVRGKYVVQPATLSCSSNASHTSEWPCGLP